MRARGAGYAPKISLLRPRAAPPGQGAHQNGGLCGRGCYVAAGCCAAGVTGGRHGQPRRPDMTHGMCKYECAAEVHTCTCACRCVGVCTCVFVCTQAQKCPPRKQRWPGAAPRRRCPAARARPTPARQQRRWWCQAPPHPPAVEPWAPRMRGAAGSAPVCAHGVFAGCSQGGEGVAVAAAAAAAAEEANSRSCFKL